MHLTCIKLLVCPIRACGRIVLTLESILEALELFFDWATAAQTELELIFEAA